VILTCHCGSAFLASESERWPGKRRAAKLIRCHHQTEILEAAAGSRARGAVDAGGKRGTIAGYGG